MTDVPGDEVEDDSDVEDVDHHHQKEMDSKSLMR
jgi:hypothetical protein